MRVSLHQLPSALTSPAFYKHSWRPHPRFIALAIPQAQTQMATTTDPKVIERAKAALLGGLVADAATMGLHWIYKPEVQAEAIAARPSSATEPEFHEPPACPFYKVPSGEFSPYGYELYAVLKYLADAPGNPTTLDGNALAKSLAESYSASTGYLNHTSKGVVAAVAEGKGYPDTGDLKDNQANSFVKAPAIVALLAGNPALPSVVEVAVRTQQNNTPAVEAGQAGAALLEKVVLGSTIAEALAWALSPESTLSADTKAQLKTALDFQGSYPDAVAKFGASCSNPGAFQNSVLAAVKFPSYVDGVRANILTLGDNASRSVLIGALLAAQAGSVDAAIPPEWRSKTHNYNQFAELADKLLARRV